MPERVTPEEDAELRRLHWFERMGFELSAPVRAVKTSIRARDKRAVIREPEDAATLGPEARVRVARGTGNARQVR